MQTIEPKNLQYFEMRARQMRAEVTANAFRALGAWLRAHLSRQPTGQGQTA